MKVGLNYRKVCGGRVPPKFEALTELFFEMLATGVQFILISVSQTTEKTITLHIYIIFLTIASSTTICCQDWLLVEDEISWLGFKLSVIRIGQHSIKLR